MSNFSELTETTPDLSAHITHFLGKDDILRLTSTNKMFRNFGHVDFDDRDKPIREGAPPRDLQKGTVRQKALLGKVRDYYARPIPNYFAPQGVASMNLRQQGINPLPEGLFAFRRSVREGTRRY